MGVCLYGSFTYLTTWDVDLSYSYSKQPLQRPLADDPTKWPSGQEDFAHMDCGSKCTTWAVTLICQICRYMGLGTRKPVFGGLQTTKVQATYQPAHLHSLINGFVIRLFGSIISNLATSEINFNFLPSLSSVAEQANT